MKIVRGPRREKFTQVPNASARDVNLSYRARGILLVLLSHRDGWQTTSDQLAQQAKEGRDAVRTALGELEAWGYLVRQQQRSDGRYADAEWKVFDVPQAAEDGDADAWKSVDGKPAGGKPVPGNPPHKKTKEEDQGEEDQASSSTCVDTMAVKDDGFAEFWTEYPARNGKKLHKAKALDKWRRLDLDERRDAWRGARHYRLAYEAGLPGVGAMDAFRWLRDRCWLDWQEPAAPQRRPGRPDNPDDTLQAFLARQEQAG